MFGLGNLKPRLNVTDHHVECPINGCRVRVPRQCRVFKPDSRFLCSDHRIYISPSTFEYENKLDNLLWTSAEDLALLNAIRGAKRESRMARDNSEDALTWNVFRHLEKTGALRDYSATLTGRSPSAVDVVYWSYSQRHRGGWPELVNARREFGESPGHGSEPDLILIADDALLWIEAKLTATNVTMPRDPENKKKYVTGGDHWYRHAFTSNYDSVAKKHKKYELLRLWLLGSWIASRLRRDFYLVSLERAGHGEGPKATFAQHLRANPHRHFLTATWEDVYTFVRDRNLPSVEGQRLLTYLSEKTIGYANGVLRPAFSIDRL